MNLSKAPGVGRGITPRDPNSVPGPAGPSGSSRRYLVRQGQSLANIAEEVYGNSSKWPVIYNANLGKIRNPAHLTPGVSLVIPN